MSILLTIAGFIALVVYLVIGVSLAALTTRQESISGMWIVSMILFWPVILMGFGVMAIWVVCASSGAGGA